MVAQAFPAIAILAAMLGFIGYGLVELSRRARAERDRQKVLARLRGDDK